MMLHTAWQPNGLPMRHDKLDLHCLEKVVVLVLWRYLDCDLKDTSLQISLYPPF